MIMWWNIVGVMVTLTFGTLVAPLAIEAQQKAKVSRVGYLWGGSPVDAYGGAGAGAP